MSGGSFGGWEVVLYEDGSREVVPIRDLRPHIEGVKADGCWCKPAYQDGILVHNSMDGRELFERGESAVH